MEEQFKREDRILKGLLDEAGRDKPSFEFKKNLMQKIELRTNKLSPYKPLISKKVWYALGVVVVSAYTLLFLILSEINLVAYVNFDFLNKWHIPQIQLSQTMQYAIAFVALFFIQIPFLKRILDRQYSI